MGELKVHPVVDEGLGNTAYLVDLADGRALVVDVSRDLRAIRAAAERRGLRIGWAADTHLHADFLSGARDLAASEGATVLASAAGARLFDHTGLADGDEVDLGGLHLRALGTPGHTDEHLAYLLNDGPRTLGVFTGGSLLVGAVARTDLVDPDRAEELARAQYRSVQRLLTLPDDTPVWPTHGAGSFCSAPAGADRTTTVGTERATNPLLAARDEDEFVARLLGSLGSYPPYFRDLPERNRRGPTPFETPTDVCGHSTPPRSPELAVAAPRSSTCARSRTSAAPTCPGPCPSPLRGGVRQLARLAHHARPSLVMVRNDDQDPDEIVWQAAKIGYDNVDSELRGGVAAWAAAGYELTGTPLLPAASLDQRRLLDVRQDSEFDAGHVAGAMHIELGSLDTQANDVPSGPLAVMCGHGERAMTAASAARESRPHRRGRRRRRTRGRVRAPWRVAGGRQMKSETPSSPGTATDAGAREVRLGLAANAAQFSLLVAVNALVGGMLGPGAHRRAASRRAGLRAARLHRRPGVHPRLRSCQGGDQLLRRHLVGPVRPQTRPGRRLAGRRPGPAAAHLGTRRGPGSSSPTSSWASARA